MKVTKLLPDAVNYRWLPAAAHYRWLQLQLTTTGFAAHKCSSWKKINCDFTRFSRKIKIN